MYNENSERRWYFEYNSADTSTRFRTTKITRYIDVDSTKKEFNVEIQRSDVGAGAKRARRNSSLLDAHILKPGDDTEDIPDSYVIFITENDVMKRKSADISSGEICHCRRK